MSPEDEAARDKVPYNGQAIREHINILHDQEMGWEAEFGALKIEPDRIYYEDLIARPDRGLRRFTNILGLEDAPSLPKESFIKRVTGKHANDWEARFRQEEKKFLETHIRFRPFTHVRTQET